MKLRSPRRVDTIELQMTPMIDIVFQLLVFFIMTFKIVMPEGDFNIRMPPPSSANPNPPEFPTLKLRMTCNEEGDLTSLRLGDELVGGDSTEEIFGQLRARIINMADRNAGPNDAMDNEVEIDFDYDLRYEYVIQAITAISGYFKDGQRYTLVDKIRFATPKN